MGGTGWEESICFIKEANDNIFLIIIGLEKVKFIPVFLHSQEETAKHALNSRYFRREIKSSIDRSFPVFYTSHSGLRNNPEI
mmetsp:Transcript_3971/g.8507  ORF Transcript_3971/g.8507 Transcript_3971/m.8507 type:complete len:82 (-) Transcript_3971:269-514(-)